MKIPSILTFLLPYSIIQTLQNRSQQILVYFFLGTRIPVLDKCQVCAHGTGELRGDPASLSPRTQDGAVLAPRTLTFSEALKRRVFGGCQPTGPGFLHPEPPLPFPPTPRPSMTSKTPPNENTHIQASTFEKGETRSANFSKSPSAVALRPCPASLRPAPASPLIK